MLFLVNHPSFNLGNATLAFRNWFVQVANILFEYDIAIGTFRVSFGNFLLTFIVLSFILSVFWKGASR